MSELEEKFTKAQEQVKTLKKRPDNDTLLKLYALYKQATEGDVSGKRPGLTDLKGKAKYDSWTKIKGTGKEKAMQDYVQLVTSLLNA
ncbi:MAG: acyl-CoA-binding protein [Desulfobacterales bacterium]|nr:acyl-CoA-binding protein [Desulfobacterales bacterium]